MDVSYLGTRKHQRQLDRSRVVKGKHLRGVWLRHNFPDAALHRFALELVQIRVFPHLCLVLITLCRTFEAAHPNHSKGAASVAVRQSASVWAVYVLEVLQNRKGVRE